MFLTRLLARRRKTTPTTEQDVSANLAEVMRATRLPGSGPHPVEPVDDAASDAGGG